MTSRPGDAARASTVRFQCKATLVRGLSTEIRRQGYQQSVAEALDPPARAALLDPPPASTWLDGRIVFEIQDVLYDLHGEPALHRVQIEAIRGAVSPFTKAATDAVMRLFGVSPAAVFSRMQTIAGSTTRGINYGYTPVTDRSGVLEIAYVEGRDVPRSAFLTSVSGFQSIYETCNTRGTIGQPEIVPDGRNAAARFRVSWDGK